MSVANTRHPSVPYHASVGRTEISQLIKTLTHMNTSTHVLFPYTERGLTFRGRTTLTNVLTSVLWVCGRPAVVFPCRPPAGAETSPAPSSTADHPCPSPDPSRRPCRPDYPWPPSAAAHCPDLPCRCLAGHSAGHHDRPVGSWVARVDADGEATNRRGCEVGGRCRHGRGGVDRRRAWGACRRLLCPPCRARGPSRWAPCPAASCRRHSLRLADAGGRCRCRWRTPRTSCCGGASSFCAACPHCDGGDGDDVSCAACAPGGARQIRLHLNCCPYPCCASRDARASQPLLSDAFCVQTSEIESGS
mmetsp:Transcript_25880/g.74503  ORF Transcript_25880/g.74503 Transcript_25880/m.74503 type:complete len:304 (-) Transcript_25880:149-1060(-)